MSRKPAVTRCPNCHELVRAAVLDWNDQTVERQWGGMTTKDLEMGRHFMKAEPDVEFFQRIRRCPRCEELFWTGEVNQALLSELVELRATVRDLREDADRAVTATTAIKKRLA